MLARGGTMGGCRNPVKTAKRGSSAAKQRSQIGRLQRGDCAAKRACAPLPSPLGYAKFHAGRVPAMGGFIVPIFEIVIFLLRIYWWIVIASAILSWLIAFRVVNTYSRPVALISDFLFRATEPALRPIRRFLPNFGGLDLSPVILLIVIWFVEMELINLEFYLYRM